MDSKELLEKIKQYPVAVGGFVLAIVFAAVYYFRSPVLPELLQQYETVEKEASVIDRNDVNSVNLDKHLEEIKAISEEIESRLINSESKTDNFSFFLGLEEETGVSMDDPSPTGYFDVGIKGSPIKTKVFAQSNYRLKIDGTLQQVLDFVYKLRTGKHLFAIDAISFVPSTAQGTDSSENITATLTVRALAVSLKSLEKGKSSK